MKKMARYFLCLAFIAAGMILASRQILAADWPQACDRQNGFAVMYDSALTPIAPNESATKLSLTSGDGQRCFVVVIANPLATAENAKSIVAAMVNNRDMMEQEYKKLYKDVYLSSVRPVIASGNYDAAMLTYAAQYEALGAEILMSVIEVHLPIRQRTYKFGCSTGRPLDDSFKSSAESFIRSFQLIPVEN